MSMRVVIFGASGMIGQGALRECLLAPDVEQVVAVSRSKLVVTEATRIVGAAEKLNALTVPNLFDLASIETQLCGLHACFFCLGLSSNGVSQSEYRRITYDLAVSIAATLFRLNPEMAFVFVSGKGTNASSRLNWAQVKGETENALLAKSARVYVLRPGAIEPLHGIRSRTRIYDFAMRWFSWMWPPLRRMFPHSVTTTEQMGRTMLKLAREGFAKRILEPRDITAM